MFSNISRVSVGPFSLFVVGRSSLLGSAVAPRRFAVAGARDISTASSAWLRQQVEKLTPDHVVVSGLARGADTVAHRAALEQGIPQIAVLPSGINNVYPRSNLRLARDIVDAGGCLVSLLPPQASPSRSSFVERNKVIAHLGHMLIVPQCAPRSGTMHTVRFARGMSRQVLFNRAGAPHLVGVGGCLPL